MSLDESDFMVRAIRRMQANGMISPEARDRMLASPTPSDPHRQIGELQALLGIAIWRDDSLRWTPDQDDAWSG